MRTSKVNSMMGWGFCFSPLLALCSLSNAMEPNQDLFMASLLEDYPRNDGSWRSQAGQLLGMFCRCRSFYRFEDILRSAKPR
ncbi:hypothetical protein DFS34DRAFT_618914 [Phlyctochytrium arcticum]|nr:hypothetical protein DFS34DRAFT_618914 [Phlyctochytrium arcticum]